MAYVVWKVINGHGPYAYLYESVWVNGRPRVRHLRYLGPWREEGPDPLMPGSVVLAPDGREVRVPEFSPSVLRHLGSRPDAPVDPGPEVSLGSRSDGAAATGAETGLGSRCDGAAATGAEAGLGSSSRPDLGSRSAAGLGSRSDDTNKDLGSRNPAAGAEPLPTPVRPHRLSDDSWGVLSQRPLAQGDLVMVSTASGKSWTATVTEVLEPVQRGYVARTSGRPQPRPGVA